jgi:transcriptional regulator with XRE-family HTH domain
MVKSIHSPEYKTFLAVLRQARRRAGITQLELATKLGKEQTFVSKCERGERRIDVIELRAICAAIGVSMKQFMAALDKKLPKTGIV